MILTRLKRLEKALRDDFDCADREEVFETHVMSSDLAWAVSQLHRLTIGLDYASVNPGEGGARFARLVRDTFTQTNEEI